MQCPGKVTFEAKLTPEGPVARFRCEWEKIEEVEIEELWEDF